MPDTDSGSESENEAGGLGNVNRVVMRPPGHTGKAKRGHLVFDAAFEGGNLGKVDYVNEIEYDLYIRPDTCNPRFRLWFNFMVENVKAEQRVIFNVVNFSKNKALFREGLSPLVRSTSRPTWQRIPPSHVYYYRSPEHHGGYVLSIVFAFDREDDVYQFAYALPYSYSRLQAYLDVLRAKNLPYFRCEVIAHSLQERKVDMLTIGSSVCAGLEGGGDAAVVATEESGETTTAPPSSVESESALQPHVVLMTGRVHPGETPSSYVLQGLINFLVSQHPVAQTLRDYVTFKIVPMANPDGVFLGNYRSNLLGCDLNRSWNRSCEWAHPVLHALKKIISELDKKTEETFDLYLDVHAHSALLGSFIYGNMYDDVYRLERHLLFPKLLSQVADDFSLDNTIYNRDPLKAGTGRRYLCGILNNRVNCYTLEISFHGYHQRQRTIASQSTSSKQQQQISSKGSCAATATTSSAAVSSESTQPIIPYTQDSYMTLGRNIAKAILEYYKSIGHIPAHLPAAPSVGGSSESGRRPAAPRTAAPHKTKGRGAERGAGGGGGVGGGMTRGSFLPGAGSVAVTDALFRATGTQALPKRVSNKRLIASSESPPRSI